MIEYWPQKQGTLLNNAVAKLFKTTKIKFNNNINNKTNQVLYFDILDARTKKHLLKLVIKQLEYLLLDTIELNLSPQFINKTLDEIIKKIVYQTAINFIKTHNTLKKNLDIFFNNTSYNTFILLKNHLLIEYLLIYLIFGSSQIRQKTFMFDLKLTPSNHVKILFENFIIQISNITAYHILNQIKEISTALNFLNTNNLYTLHYLSSRSLAMFKNNVFWQNITLFYIEQPKEIYSSKYKVWLFSKKGIISKYIFLSRTKDINKLNKMQLLFLLFLEIQDIIIPQLEKLFLIITKIIIYTIINIIGNILLVIIRTILNQIKNK